MFGEGFGRVVELLPEGLVLAVWAAGAVGAAASRWANPFPPFRAMGLCVLFGA
jgi:hypothetical protein